MTSYSDTLMLNVPSSDIHSILHSCTCNLLVGGLIYHRDNTCLYYAVCKLPPPWFALLHSPALLSTLWTPSLQLLPSVVLLQPSDLVYSAVLADIFRLIVHTQTGRGVPFLNIVQNYTFWRVVSTRP